MICAIHQPNFFPWLGFFDKIKRCDKFVILDSVQFAKTGGGTYGNRVTINIQGQSKWITAPINRPNGLWNINETTFQDTNWRDKIIKTLIANYSKAPFFKKNKDFIFDLVNFKNQNLSEYNLNSIIQICQFLGIDANKIALSSKYGFSTSSNKLLIDLTKAVGCDTYMAGSGASEYQNIDLFYENRLKFVYQDFVHPIYKQNNAEDFIKGLSVIDYIFNARETYEI
ncbi:WbqC family protein [Campylobacter hyointestinalis]|uniref:WbqC family protein n=1 Tax=Campylobacter hyointestinalis TaxID=198 RepID=UPI000DCBDB85|nr:WbqC family protein [Campylobacter hyointestinalis]RAZ24209.1 wbmP [Campylobacter hyointestinalis subsp. lawsonii]RAZ38559.1 wbmP [Campylobacter hyointestinalis subsp. lawsonii]RAZ51786.1 wbmP [Campylobacter hyointestinalis subsp. lawsonii]